MHSQDNFIPLESIKIAKPCRADWDKMTGSGRARFCQTCQKKVYNLSGMTRAEAEELIRRQEGKLCVRFYRRADGTVITQDCPVGKKMVRRPVYWLAASIAAFLSSGMAVAHQRNERAQKDGTFLPCGGPVPVDRLASLRQVPIVKTAVNWVSPPPNLEILQCITGTPSFEPSPTPTPLPESNMTEQNITTTVDVESEPSSDETID